MTSTRQSLVCTRQLIVGYANKPAATVPDLDFHEGRIWHVIGPNGSGKTAFLKTLAGLLPPVSGRVVRRCRPGRGGAIYVHSVPYLFAGSVSRNLSLAHPRQEVVKDVVDMLGLSAVLDREAASLSHGQQRRLALARALVGRPALLLVDEPEGGLDDEAVLEWRAYLVRAVEALEPVVVMATHRRLALGVPVTEVHLE